MRVIENPFDVHFTDRSKAVKLAKQYNGRVRNNSFRIFGQTQAKQKTDHFAVRITPRSFAVKLEIVQKAKELGSVPDPWKS